ncbi:STM4014 family protein, partial [Salmonella enterica subsp. enterica]
AGIDVLLTTSLTPYIIEINGQGDLIYQDAQQNNLIYQTQIRAMRKQNV